jgi:hypothetical protein
MKKLLTLCLLLIALGCSKSNNSNPAATKTQLISKTWKQTDILAALGGGVQASVFSTALTACQQDNLWQFRSDGTYTIFEGPSRCPASSSDVVATGTWTFQENETKISFTDTVNGTQSFTILELTSTMMKLTGILTYQGAPVNVTVIFTAI